MTYRSNGRYIRRAINEDGKTEITLEISSPISLDKDKIYRIEFKEAKSSRTLQQNAYLWAIIHDISVNRNGDRATDDDDMTVYVELLEKANAKFEYIACLPEADRLIRQQFRAVRLLNQFEHKGKVFNQYKVFVGSSKFDTAEMAKLIDMALDVAMMEGAWSE